MTHLPPSQPQPNSRPSNGARWSDSLVVKIIAAVGIVLASAATTITGISAHLEELERKAQRNEIHQQEIRRQLEHIQEDISRMRRQ